MVRSISHILRSTYRLLLAGSLLASSWTIGSVAAGEMRYDIKPDQVVPYRVKIVAETPAEKDTMSGIIAFTGKQADATQCTITYRGGLVRKKQAKASSSGGRGPRGFRGRPGGGPPIPRSPFSRFGSGVTFEGLTQASNDLVVARQGEIKKLTGKSQLPYLLGHLSIMPFEPLPDGEQKSWESGSGISITQGRSSRFPRGPFGSGQQESTTGGSETASYTIQQDDGKQVTIRKTYRLHSPAASKDDETLEIKGSGTFVFNRELGLPESLDFKQNLIVNSDGSSVAIPMTVAWNRISEEEYEAHLKARADQIAALRKRAEDRKAQGGSPSGKAGAKPLDVAKKEEILAELRSDKWAQVAARLGRLTSYKPHPDDADVALVIRDLQNHDNRIVSMRATQLWKKWSAVVDESAGGKTPGGSPQPAENPFGGGDGKAAGRQLRTWSDSTGTFQVEAVFLKIDGNNVVLERKDGKELKVPLDRLSKADQAIVETIGKSSAGKNPFE